MLLKPHFYSFTSPFFLSWLRFFADMLHKDMEGEREALQRGPVSLLALLPQEFTKEQVKEVRIAQGLKPDPVNMLKNWKRRGYVEEADKGVYRKVVSGVSVS